MLGLVGMLVAVSTALVGPVAFFGLLVAAFAWWSRRRRSADVRVRAIGAVAPSLVDELVAVQGKSADIGGYYYPDPEKTAAVMRPSKTFNDALAKLGK